MPAALKQTNLREVAPSPEELEAARAVLRGGQGTQRARMASMTNWLKNFPGGLVEQSRGEEATTTSLWGGLRCRRVRPPPFPDFWPHVTTHPHKFLDLAISAKKAFLEPTSSCPLSY